MDDKLTAVSSSNGIGSGESSDTQPATNSRELFAKLFPYYLAMGMTYDEFYDQDHELVIAYRKAEKMKQERQQEQSNYDKWLQGLYVYQAVSRVAPLLIPFNKHPKAEPYLDKPIPLTKEDAERDSNKAVENKGIAYMKAKMIELNKRFGKE